MNGWEFMADSPYLTFFLAFIIGSVIKAVAEAIAKWRVGVAAAKAGMAIKTWSGDA